MKKILHPRSTRGSANYGWLKANYSFSFANYFNPDRLQFGMLRVLNDDYIAPAMGFGQHPHADMEIVTIPLSGALHHKDSMGNEGIVYSGDIQVMSAGSGIEHSERNASTKDPISLLQIWIFPETKNVAPRYDQKKIASLINPNTFSTVVRPKSEASNGDLWIHQQAYFSIGEFNDSKTTTYLLKNSNQGAYIFVIKGEVLVDNEKLNEKDAIGVWDTSEVTITAEKNSKVLLIEVPMN